MVLRMPFLRQNRVTNIWEYRRRVPDDLRALLGKREEKKSFGTRDRRRADLGFAIHHAEVEMRWRKLREGVRPLTQKQCEALAGEVYREIVEEDSTKPISPFFPLPIAQLWNMEIVDGDVPAPKHRRLGPYSEELEALHGERLDKFLLRRGLVVDDPSRHDLLVAVQRAAKQAKRVAVKRITEGDYSPDPQADRFPAFEEKPDTGLPLMAVFHDWVEKRKPAASTIPAWRAIIEKFIAFTKIDDARKIRRGHVKEWRDALEAQGVSGVRIRDGYIAALRSVLAHGLEKDMLETNAAAGIKVTVPDKEHQREKDLNNQEIYIILRASLGADTGDGRHSEASIASRRWVPWLCAYSGARIAEITGLQFADIIQEDGYHGIFIKKSKTGLARKVPLHSHTIEQGFLDFVMRHGKGPLFLTPHKSERGIFSSPTTRGEKLAKWVRDIGVIDEDVSPNHGWRHRFRTEARLIEMREDVMNYLMGHAPSKEGDRYGHIPFGVTGPWIAALPRFDVGGSELVIARNRRLSPAAMRQMMQMLAAEQAGAD